MLTSKTVMAMELGMSATIALMIYNNDADADNDGLC